MVNEEFFSVAFNDQLVADDFSTNFFFEIPESPHIMIAFEECDFNALVGQLSEFS